MGWCMSVTAFVRSSQTRLVRTLAVATAAAIWCCTLSGSALAQNTAGPPEVTVDLSVLDSLGRTPSRQHDVVPRPPRERSRAAVPEHKPAHTAAKKQKPPAKKAAVKPARTPTRAATAESRQVSAREARRDETERAARDEEIWEADRKREETDRKRAEADRKRDESDRIKREEAERLKKAKAEIEEAARSAKPPAKTSENILTTGPGPATPPPPTPPKQAAEQPAKPPGQVAAMTPPPASPPQPSATAAPLDAPAPAPLRPKPAAAEAPASATPHVDFAVGTADLSAAARAELDALAKRLNTDQDERLQLIAYATGSQDEANQARRLSLSRALNVRAYLIDHGVRNTRMDVRALGNRPDGNKPADRVEILLLK